MSTPFVTQLSSLRAPDPRLLLCTSKMPPAECYLFRLPPELKLGITEYVGQARVLRARVDRN